MGFVAPVVKGIGKLLGFEKPQMPQLPAPPASPDYNKIQADETQALLKKNQNRTKTILTNPLGVTPDQQSGNVNIQRKKLLGE